HCLDVINGLVRINRRDQWRHNRGPGNRIERSADQDSHAAQKVVLDLKVALKKPRLSLTIQSVLTNVAHHSNDFEPSRFIRFADTDAAVDRIFVTKVPSA